MLMIPCFNPLISGADRATGSLSLKPTFHLTTSFNPLISGADRATSGRAKRSQCKVRVSIPSLAGQTARPGERVDGYLLKVDGFQSPH